jgi:aldose 1-epimerase
MSDPSDPLSRVDDLLTLRNRNGMEMRATAFGARIVSLYVPDRSGRLADIVLGYDSLREYQADDAYFGAIVGRVANRTENASFELDGVRYELLRNHGPHHLHGGPRGFSSLLWKVGRSEDHGAASLVFRYTSHDGDQGYPGNVRIQVTYSLTNDDCLVFDYRAVSDRPTPINITQHSYFNLAGHGTGDVSDHRLTVNASRFTAVDSSLIPTGDIRFVESTPLDFRNGARLGAVIDDTHEQIRNARGLDHNLVPDRPEGSRELFHAVRLYEATGGRTMDVLTTEPGLQVYSGNFLDGRLGKEGARYLHHAGLCLETQHYPNSPNCESFPSIILRPGMTYHSRTVLRFSCTP